MLLAIDTSAGTSVAVVDRDRGVLSLRESADTRRHAELIGTFIAEALAEASVTPSQLSGVAVGMGPGPFTGLRVGIAAARAFALGIGRPVVPIASHDAVALGEAGPIIVVTDARRRELAWSTYGVTDELGLPVRESGPGLVKADELATLPGFEGYRLIEAATIPADRLGMLAERLYAAGRPFASSEPLYLRSPDVTVSAGPKRVTT